MTSELGNVTPVLASPGAWSEADMKRMADHVATSMLSNAGCNCLAPKLLVLPEEWHLVRGDHSASANQLHASMFALTCLVAASKFYATPAATCILGGVVTHRMLTASGEPCMPLQADAFIAAVKTALRTALPEPAWYPNAEATWNSFCSDHENVSKVEQTGGSTARGAPPSTV